MVLTQDGKIDAIVLDVGGFLGLGEKPVAIAFDDLKVMADQNGKLYAYTTFTKDQLEAAPSYNKDTYAEDRDRMRFAPPTSRPASVPTSRPWRDTPRRGRLSPRRSKG